MQHVLKALNGYLNITETGDITLSGSVIYTMADSSEVKCLLRDTVDGVTSWADPDGVVIKFTSSLNGLADDDYLDSALHGSTGKDAKGNLYGKAVLMADLSNDERMALRPVYQPSLDVYKVIGGLGGSVNKRFVR